MSKGIYSRFNTFNCHECTNKTYRSIFSIWAIMWIGIFHQFPLDKILQTLIKFTHEREEPPSIKGNNIFKECFDGLIFRDIKCCVYKFYFWGRDEMIFYTVEINGSLYRINLKTLEAFQVMEERAIDFQQEKEILIKAFEILREGNRTI
ncbi:MAG: hypothetical protein LBH05_02400, partial [Deferribacteraceae bacterium]|nr:hypothetical protein [Deferribacteraceae bacterium]